MPPVAVGVCIGDGKKGRGVLLKIEFGYSLVSKVFKTGSKDMFLGTPPPPTNTEQNQKKTCQKR